MNEREEGGGAVINLYIDASRNSREEGSQIKRSKKNSDRPLTAKHCTFQLKEVAQDIQ